MTLSYGTLEVYSNKVIIAFSCSATFTIPANVGYILFTLNNKVPHKQTGYRQLGLLRNSEASYTAAGVFSLLRRQIWATGLNNVPPGTEMTCLMTIYIDWP